MFELSFPPLRTSFSKKNLMQKARIILIWETLVFTTCLAPCMPFVELIRLSDGPPQMAYEEPCIYLISPSSLHSFIRVSSNPPKKIRVLVKFWGLKVKSVSFEGLFVNNTNFAGKPRSYCREEQRRRRRTQI